MYIYPDSLAPTLRRYWASHPDWMPPGHSLPSDELLGELLGVAYHASLSADEQRRASFRLIYGTPAEIRLTSEAEPVLFSSSRPFDAVELVRLAPATEVTQVMICVGPDEAGQLRIWGLLDEGSSWWALARGDADTGRFPPDRLGILSSEPGRLVVFRSSLAVLVYDHGEVSQGGNSVLHSGPVARRFETPALRLCQEAFPGPACETLLGRARQLYSRCLARLLFHIRDKRHGGTLIFLPEGGDLAGLTRQELLRVKYSIDYDGVWRLMKQTIAADTKGRDEELELLAGDCISREQYGRVRAARKERRRRAEALADSLKFIAALSEVDGAIVLTETWRVLGFGVEVLAATCCMSDVQIAHDAEGDSSHASPIDTFGTRHRSVFRLVAQERQVAAFVISQDGEVRAVARRGEDVLVWPEILTGVIGERFLRASQELGEHERET